ncbi:caspase family protein, partial [Microcoleus sp. F10-D1]
MTRHDFERNFAIIIGINNYAQRPLRAAKNDAEKLAQILSSEERTLDERYKVLLLTDEQATHSELTKLLQALKEGKIHFSDGETVELKDNNRLLIYFSGHGVASSLEDSQKVRNEAEKEKILNKQFLQCQDGKSLPLKSLFDALKPLNCRHLLLILDCCFAGQAINNTGLEDVSVSRTASFEDDSEIKYERQYKLMYSQPAWTAITSSGYEEALDSKNSHQIHSYFARALFKVLDYKTAKKSDYNDDDIITDNEIYTYLKNDKFVNEYQSPQKFTLTFTGKKQSGQYFFILPDFEPTKLEEILDQFSPYKGLLSYEKGDALLFRGRKRLVEELFKRVYENKQKLTVVTGASGSGKSSLVKAGLLAKIEKENESPQSNTSNNPKLWKIFGPIRPGESPFKALVNAVEVPQASDNTNISELSKKLDFFYEKLNHKSINPKGFAMPGKLIRHDENLKKEIADVFNELTNEFIQQLSNEEFFLLVIDQFEELVTLCQPLEQEYFLKLLAQMLNKSENLKIVLTVRSDFEIYFRGSSTTSNSPDTTTDLNISQYWNKEARLVVDEMNIDELKQAIEKPARLFGVDFESDQLVNDIIDDVRGMPGALALLSFTLEKLYQDAKNPSAQNSREPITITQQHYTALGGVAKALTNKATDVYDKLGKKLPENHQISTKEKDKEDEKFTKEYERECKKLGKPIPAEDESAGQVRQAMMKQLMLRMVTIQGGKLTKRPVPKSELQYPDWRCRHKDATYRMCQVIDRLIKERLIVSNLNEYVKNGQKVEMSYVEPAHDALILYWDKLSKKDEGKEQEQENQDREQGWLEEQEENWGLRERLITEAQDWYERERELKKYNTELEENLKYLILSGIKVAINIIPLIINSLIEQEAKNELFNKIKWGILKLVTIVLGMFFILLGILLLLALVLILFDKPLVFVPWSEFLIGLLIFGLIGLVLIWLGLFFIHWKLAFKVFKLLAFFIFFRLLRRTNPQLEQNYNLSIKDKKSNNTVNPGNSLWENNTRLEQVRPFLYSQDSWLNQTETEFVRQSVIRKRQSEIKLSVGALVVIVGATILTGVAWLGQRDASIKKVHALTQSAEANLQSKNELEAAVDILRARKAFEEISFNKPDTEKAEVQRTLHKVFYAAIERNRLQNRGPVYDMALSSDGELLAVVGKNDTVFIYKVPPNNQSWNYQIWSFISKFIKNFRLVKQLDSRADTDNKLEHLDTFSTKQDNVYSVAFSRLKNGSKFLATGAADGTVKLWKIEQIDGKINPTQVFPELPINTEHSEATQEPSINNKKRSSVVKALAFDPEGKKLAIGREDGTVTLW